MKLAIIVLLVLPLVYSASVDEKRFIEQLLGGVDILDLAKTAASQFSTDETEQQCETAICPSLVDHITHNTFVQNLICGAVCKEAQVLAGQIH